MAENEGRRIIRILDELEHKPIELSAVLAALEPEAVEYRWVVLELEGVASSTSELNILELEALIDRHYTGLVLTWPELKTLAADLNDVWNALIVGFKEPVEPKRGDPASWRRSEFVVDRFDSTEWTIAANSAACRRLEQAYRSARPSSWRRDDSSSG